ncbi:peptidase M64 [Labilibacter sediminis]|nr:peptidase M64 [Labilibacter sediminis]
MKHFTIILFLFAFVCSSATAQYRNFFTEKSLRIDFVLTGNHLQTQASVFELKQEPYWGGSTVNTIDAFEYGEFRVLVKDSTQQNIIFSRGFCTLFEEWQTTDEAQLMDKSFFQTAVCPFPKSTVHVSIEKRNKAGKFISLLNTEVNPNSYSILKTNTNKVTTHKLIDNGSASECVDIVFIGDGYTMDEIDKFHADIKDLSEYLFTQTPFNKYKNRFNIWAVDAISEHSGVTDPRKNSWKNTAVRSSFNTLNSDRYLESTHTYLIRDYAGLVPYDQIYVIANTKKYGGGGIYNHFSLTSVDNPRSKTVFIHEFGHSFAGLGDEYYTSETSYNDFYNLNTEPWQPNLTTMVDFDSKWKPMLDKDIPVPTPASEEYFNAVGVFEGGGYVSKGIFRPAYNCRMKSNEAPGFCPVCQHSIEKMVLFLIGE